MNDEKNYFLTFAIPTRNRAPELRECLESILHEILQSKHAIEIVVSDNASSDQTESILKEYQTKYAFIKYFRLQQNMGYDLNLLNAIQKSSGNYIWTFSDDDLVTNGAVNHICKLIEQTSPNYILTNYSQFTIKEGIKVFPSQDKAIIKFDKMVKMVLKDLDFIHISLKMTYTMSFLSINIYKSNEIDTFAVKPNLQFLKSWSHIFLFAQSTRSGGGVITPFKCVSQRTQKCREP